MKKSVRQTHRQTCPKNWTLPNRKSTDAKYTGKTDTYVVNNILDCNTGTPLTLNAPIATKVVCFSRLLKCLRSLHGKQCGPRSDCSYWSSLFWVHAVCFYTYFASNVRLSFAADDFSRRHCQKHFSPGALRIKYMYHVLICLNLVARAADVEQLNR